MSSTLTTPPATGTVGGGHAGDRSAPLARPPGVAESERFRLARLALAAALEIAGVVATDSGPGGRCVTEDRGRRLEGVTCIAAPGSGYEVSLRLICDLVPLHALGMQVRAAVTAAAAGAAIPLERVDVHVATVVDGAHS